MASRFDQPDPSDASYDLTDPQSLNRYAYVNNDPVNFVDPTGLIRYIGPAPTVDPLYLRFLFFTPGVRGTGGDEGGAGSQSTAGPVVDESDLGPPPSMGCDNKLAKIFGGPGAVVGSTHDPRTLAKYSNVLAYHASAGTPLPSNFGDRGYGHGPVPVPPRNPKYPEDAGGIIHIYGNAQGTTKNTGLYTPPGGTVGKMFITKKDNSQINVSYNRGPYAGLTIAFVHVSAGSGPPNAAGSVRIGNIGGRGGQDAGYIHSHLVFFQNGVRVDPRTVFCKEFGF